MESARRSAWVYGLLFVAWCLVLGWQTVEHVRVQKAARAELINRVKDISNTVGIVLRSQRRFGGVISKDRIESALTLLVHPGELNAVALLNAAGDVVASAGTNVDLAARSAVRRAELWERETVTLVNLVDLGTNVTRDLEGTNPPIVLSREAFGRPGDTNRPPPDGRFIPPPPEREPPSSPPDTNAVGESISPPPEGPDRSGGREGDGPRPPRRPNDGDRRWRFGRPPWMSEAEFKSMIERQGVHSFLITMSTQPVRSAMRQDLWLRGTIGVLATLAVFGLGLAWRNLAKSSELQIRLVRASELNSHLRELNLAAAGLAHETRNPLNIVRGLAQMISKEADLPAEIRQKSRGIVDETDRVTAQLNEFINYSRPREVRRATVALGTVVDEVVRALNFDVEEKQIRIETSGTQISIEADEQLLRQALFNLVLNAVQAVAVGGQIWISAGQDGSNAVLEIKDNGPGVPPERRLEIFKPYFTTNEKGTGLGLAVVQQIILAHGWEIACMASEPSGARFRLTHLKLANAKV
jgi:signal transduction histidine kinase